MQSSFTAFSNAQNDDARQIDIFSLSGVPILDVLTGRTDRFVLQLGVAGVTLDSVLSWFDPSENLWVNAVDGNFGGTAFFAGNKAYNPATDFVLGFYGVDTQSDTVWAVLNHNSEFSIVPEPASLALIVAGLAIIASLRRPLRR